MKHYAIEIAHKKIVDKVNHTILYTYNVYRVFLGFIYIPVWVEENTNPALAYDACENWIRVNHGLKVTK